jgi:adenylosuccinate lyase
MKGLRDKDDFFRNPLVERYSSRAMLRIFSPRKKFLTWRDLWIQLAQAQHELGLPVTEQQIEELKATRDDLDLARAAQLEKDLRHDVMAHIRAWGEKCPGAAGIIHLGATSAFVTDNTELILMKQALHLVKLELVRAIRALADQAERHANLPCLGYTHFQVAQPTTVGKRICCWIQDLVLDQEALTSLEGAFRARGVKGTTGTQASFLQLFDGDEAKVRELDQRVSARIGFSDTYPVTGQTYPRKFDFRILSALAGVAASTAKFGNDIRLLSHEGEIEEPFERKQVGSSAMPHKRNPMRCERLVSLARYALTLPANAAFTAADQWLERTLDDSANRRITIPEAFLAVDACLVLVENVARGMTVFPERVTDNLAAEIPTLMAETVLMEGVKRGGDRQALHEKLREITVEAGRRRREGRPIDLVARLAEDLAFDLDEHWLRVRLDPAGMVGRAPGQVQEFLGEVVEPLMELYQAELRSLDQDELKV